MSIQIKILESEKEIKDMIMASFVKQVNKQIANKHDLVLSHIKGIVGDRLRDTEEYERLTQGDLAAEFGFMAGRERKIVDAIIDKIVDNITSYFDDFFYNAGTMYGSFRIHMLVADFSDIFGLPEAITRAEGYGHEDIPWLFWYLTQGGQAIVADYGIVFGEFPENSRSGLAVMIKNGGPYIVSGDNSYRDNWFTRFFSSQALQNDIGDLVELMFKG